MTRNQLIAMVLLAAGAAGGATYLVRQQSAAVAPSGEAGKLFESVAARVNDVAELRVKRGSRPDGELVIKRSAAGGWEIENRGGYPAKFATVKETIVGVAELARTEPRTTREESYEKLGVQDPAKYKDTPEGEMGAGAVPTLVTLKAADGAELASVIVGGSKAGNTPAVYVRKPTEAQSWLSESRMEIPPSLVGWVEPEFIKIPRERVKSAASTAPDGSTLLVTRATPSDASFTVQNVPEGKKLRGPSAGDGLGAAIATVSLDDVAAVGSIDFDGKGTTKPAGSAEFRTFDGVVLTAHMVEVDGRTWAKFAATFDADAKAPEGQPGMKSPDEAKKEVEAINASVGRFAFALPAWKATVLRSKLADMLDDKPPVPPPSLNDGNAAPQPFPAPPTGATPR